MSVVSSHIDLRKFSPQILNQLSLNSCVADTLTAAIRLQGLEYRDTVGPLAREQIWYDSRIADHGAPNSNTGTFIETMLPIAQATGIASQDVALPYSSPVYVSGQPGWVGSFSIDQRATNPAVYNDAYAQRITGYTSYSKYANYVNGDWLQGRDPTVLQNQVNKIVQTELMHGKAVLVASFMPQWFFNSMPSLINATPDTSNHDYRGGQHAFLIVGKDDSLHGGKGAYIIQNSHGSAYGDNGYGTIPYNYFAAGIDFSEVAVVNGFRGIDLTWSPQTEKLAMLYSSLYDRAPDHSGMAYWSNALKHGGTTLSSLADAFYNTAEGTAKYSKLSNADFVNEIYLNTMGEAVDAGGREYWAGVLSNGGLSRGGLVAQLIDSVANTSGGAGAPSMAQHDFLINRATVGQNFAITYQLEGGNRTEYCLDGVTSDANTVEAALIGIQSHMPPIVYG